ncbi:hypothetical protein EKO04_006339 [Ascochyta lentis]|uniref:YDG domain-containing protein n=1 Tax=Ascochyta lentis TaxID=205686 RepID=A0A8H7J2B5_9PLEO|nr:hypothetical protein EKO04_006339 [Ascochyta lentis]
MQPVTRTPPLPDIPRCKLKQIARWIRDDLDILVAREGPNVLQPDDVVFLHELFVALSRSITITIEDLRATGIHKAVKDIAGVATRWPGRLCDDCDKIIVLWTSKFGRLDDLHPFLCGRGGRLEGIASVIEYTRQALLRRWSEHCPEKIHPSVSHRQGDLGFKPGDWWINTLFAHHAGIIGLESLQGGTTYNKKAAYALVLKDTGEIDGTSEDFFTYRFPLNDKGKFRLTAATPASRQPIRVLRCHSINSIWGPKAGIRYEGVYAVKGWCVRLATLKDIFSGEGNVGDVLYEVTMQRTDRVSMEEVSKRPTNMEVDDYAEYKRLRKRHREHKRGAPGQLLMPQQPFKAAPPILPLQVSGSSIIAPQSMLRASSPSVSRKANFKEPVFDAPKASQEPSRPPAADIVSPMTSPDRQGSFFVMETSAAPAMPATGDKDKPSPSTSFETVSHQKEAQILSSITSSVRSGQSDLKVILPWIDLETDSPLPAPSDAPPVITKEVPSQATDGLEAQAAEMNPVKKVRRLARDLRRPSDTILQSQEARKKSTATNPHSLRFYPARPILGGKEEEKWETRRDKLFKKTLFGKKPKFFDGAGYNADEDFESVPSHACTPYVRSSSSDGAIQLHSPPSIRPPTPGYLLADLTPSHGVEDIEFASPLENLISPSRMMTVGSCIVPPVVARARRIGVVGSVVGSLRRMASRLS